MAAVLLTTYFALLASLSLLGVHRLLLIVAAARARKVRAVVPGLPRELPKLVVQLPIYNEPLVAERLLLAASRLRWPGGALELQVLDDSTDETRHLVARVARELAAAGVPIRVLRRSDRAGFKAGALAYGLSATDAELVAIFDADFVPAPDLLEQLAPSLLADPAVGMVQARWGHHNRETSLFTRAQAVFLDGHFAVEHEGRAALGHFFNFNGTAGIWRRRAIEEAGGWAADTITEDLDLSYRAQLAGWRFRYAGDVVAPAELPESWIAFRSQQSRWVRGSVETARKHLLHVLGARGLTPGARADAALHLLQNFAYLAMAALAVLLPLAVVVRAELAWRVPGGRALLSALDLTMLGGGTGVMIVFYATALRFVLGPLELRRAVDITFALCIGAGMSLSNAREVLAGLVSRGSEFVRTPKRGDGAREAALRLARPGPLLGRWVLDLMFAAYFAVAIVHAIDRRLYAALPFLLLYLIGFVAVGTGVALERVEGRLRERVGAADPPARGLQAATGPGDGAGERVERPT